MKSFGESKLYTFVDTAYLRGRDPVGLARQLCVGGSDIIQLRAKKKSAHEIKGLAHAILQITRSAGVPLVINDYADIAAEVGAECVHLGQEDFFDAGLSHRVQLSTLNSQLGLSSHAPEQARRAVEAGADYIAVGPVFATGTKPGRAPVTLDYVRWAAANVRLPWFAIGGITLENIDDVLAAGARRVCVVSAILNAPDVAEACREFKRRLT
ncbi:MAG TPA: thiamine phosphate synthase [Candidatus Limnocylindria bacterium]|nr:thiamine phosphate synthase [Candidatus Limnocylindria bacterium]